MIVPHPLICGFSSCALILSHVGGQTRSLRVSWSHHPLAKSYQFCLLYVSKLVFFPPSFPPLPLVQGISPLNYCASLAYRFALFHSVLILCPMSMVIFFNAILITLPYNFRQRVQIKQQNL